MSPGITLQRGCAYASATLLIGASAGFGAQYAWTIGSTHGAVLGGLSVAMALGLELAKPLAIERAVASVRSLLLGRALALLTLGLIAIAYSLTAELALVATTRGDRVAERQAQAGAAKAVQEARERLLGELSGLASSRPSAALEAILAAMVVNPRASLCGDPKAALGPATRRLCSELANVKAEHAVALRREEISRELRPLEDLLTGSASHAVSSPDPAASALVTYLALAGVKVPVADLTDWLVLVPVLALEIGSALALVLVQSVSTSARVQSRSGASGMGLGAPSPSPASPWPLTVVNTSPALQITSCARETLLEHLRGRGGMVQGGLRGIARDLGVSTTRLHQVVREMALEGLLEVQSTKHGTALKLA